MISQNCWSPDRMGRIRIKVCCIASIEEAMMAISAGANALGLVAEMPSGPGPIADELIAEIADSVPPPISTFLLTAQTDADAIIDHHARCRTSTLQLVDYVEPQALAKIRREIPHTRLVQVIHVTDPDVIDEARAASEYCHALLLDSGNPNLAIKELGGTGRTHDWSISRRIIDEVDLPVFLAGGLRESNAAQAITAARPFGLDLCSGVRTNGRLDPTKLNAFMQAAQTL